MSAASKARNKEKRKAKKLQAKAARKARYLAESKAGKLKGQHQQKRLDPNRYGRVWAKQQR